MKKILFRFFLMLVFIFPIFLFAQQKDKTKAELKLEEVYTSMGKGNMDLAYLQIDTLIAVAEVEKDLLHLGLGWNAKAEYFLMSNKKEEAIPLFKKALYYFEKANSNTDIFRQYTGIGQCFTSIGQLDSALYYLNQADTFQDRNDIIGKSNAGSLNVLKARVYSQLGKIDKAIEYFHLTLENDPEPSIKRMVHDDLAFEYLRLYNFDKADKHADLAFEYHKNQGTALGFNRLNKARIATYKGAFDTAENYILECLDNYKKSAHNEYVPFAKAIYAGIKVKKQEFESAKALLSEIDESNFKPKTDRYSYYFLTKAEYGIKTNDLKETALYLAKAEGNAKELNNLFVLRNILETKANYFEKINNPTKQIKALKQFQLLNDSLINIQRLNIAENIAAEFQTKQKEQVIAQLEFEDEVKASKLKTQQIIIIGFLIGLSLLGGLLFQLLRRNKQIKTQNQVIAKALSDKDILLREIHHRVKNNLQLVSSLLGLQGMTTKDEHIKEAINAGKSRVMSMALIHQDLYNKEKLTSVNVKEYLDKLCQELINTYQLSADLIQLETEIEELDLDVETLIPLGLIINELLTNALKYAFPHNQHGIIHVKLFEKDNLLHLEVNDNGVGLSDNVAPNSSFGFRMIRSLLRQLDGEMQSEGTDGTQFQFQFKDYKKVA